MNETGWRENQLRMEHTSFSGMGPQPRLKFFAAYDYTAQRRRKQDKKLTKS